MIRVMVIDDHPIVRTGIKSLLAEASDIEVVCEAADGEEGLEKAPLIRPDVIILDISLPGMSGMEVLQSLRQQTHGAAILVLSLHPEDRYAIRLLRAGASAYLTKGAPSETLIRAIRKVSRGGKYISSKVAERLAFNLDPDFDRPLHDNLSRRELEVTRLLASGKTVTEIGRQLAISVKTVSTYRRRILEKLAMQSTAEIVRYAVENRLVE
ncbi:MAG: response regulator transcription factor [Acidobacteriota bacterium]